MYPLTGKEVVFDYKKFKFQIKFKRNNILVFTGISPSNLGQTDTVKFYIKQVEPEIYMLTWKESRYKDIVTQVQNFKNMSVISSIWDDNGKLVFVKGKMILCN